MGKAFDKEYFFAGTRNACGNMRCVDCGGAVDNQNHDWMAAKKTYGDDWGYITRHRECTADQSGWENIKAAEAATEQRIGDIVAELSRYRDAKGNFEYTFYEALERLGLEYT